MVSYRNAAVNYRTTDVYGAIEDANGHALVALLYERLGEDLYAARHALEAGDIAGKCKALRHALDVLDVLRAGLDFERGGEIAANLDALYDYMQRRLVFANVENCRPPIDEVAGLLAQIRSAWAALDRRTVAVGP